MPRKVPEGRRFKKGQSGNARGSSERMRTGSKIKKLTLAQLEEVAALLLNGTFTDLMALIADAKSSLLTYWMASLIEKSIEKGDVQTFKVLVERLLGRPRETIDLGSDPNRPLLIEQQTVEQKLARLEELRRAREEDADD